MMIPIEKPKTKPDITAATSAASTALTSQTCLAVHGTPVARTLGVRGQEAAHAIGFVRTAADGDIAQSG
jgi:hypothetical protein